MLTDEVAYKLLRMLEADPNMSQREIAKTLGISLGKANHCIKSLIEKGVIKARNFYKSNNKSAYAYIITPAGIEEKAKLTYRFLQIKMQEYAELEKEIEEIREEARQLQNVSGVPTNES